MEWRAMDKSEASIVGNSPLQSVQRAWRSILPEFSFLLEFIHMEETKQGYQAPKRQDKVAEMSSQAHVLMNKISRFR